MRVARSWLMAVLAVVPVGCASEPDDFVTEPEGEALTRGDVMVGIARRLGDKGDAALADAKSDFGFQGEDDANFFLAIHRNALSEKWFWSVYLKDLHPFGPSPRTLGTRVVRFREQNGKLFVFDADNRRAQFFRLFGSWH